MKMDRMIVLCAFITIILLMLFPRHNNALDKVTAEEVTSQPRSSVAIITDINGDVVTVYDGWDSWAYIDNAPNTLSIGQYVTITIDGREVTNVTTSPFMVAG